MVAPEPLPDGRVVSWARFETGPILGAAGLSVLALAGYGLLRRHWRHAGLEVRRPERALPQTRAVLVLGGLSVGLYAVRKTVQLIAHAPFVPYVPVVGGLIELAVLFFVWSSILEAWRTGRSLARERLLWLGLGLAVAPPVTDFLLYVRAWRP
jgi:serine/threonine-protein kinase